MFDGTSDPKVHLRTCCDKLMGVRKDERIRMKLFMRSFIGDALSWYISQNPKKWANWVSMASDFMDQFRFNTENAPDVFYIQNLKKKPTETFHEYATWWRSEVAKVRPALDEEQMNRFFVRAHDPQYYERLMVIKNHKFSNIIKLGERIEEGIKSGMVTNFEALQATNKKLQSGGISKKKEVGAKEAAPNFRNNPLPDHRGERINVIETDEEWDPDGSIGPLKEGDDPKKPAITFNPIVVQVQLLVEVEVTASVPFEVEVTPPAATPIPFEVEVATPFTLTIATTPPFKSNAIPWDYVSEARRKGKIKTEKSGAAQGMTRIGRVYTLENLGGSSKKAATKQHVIETGLDGLWRKIQAREYSSVDHLNKTPTQISILSLLQNSEAYKSTLMEVLNEAYLPNNITSVEMANMVGQGPNRWGFKPQHLSIDYSKKVGQRFYEIRARSMHVKAFDGSQRDTIGEINLCLQMGPTWFDVEFQEEALVGLRNLFLEDETIDCNVIAEEEEEEGLTIQTVEKGSVLRNWTATPSRARQVPGLLGN
ncbi:uncharacterized protein [Nicotiana sylvestris]|uniref:uncharacterized protein n=1 Tax=Nicotiana sylvestris TaxID=4096 RepID=UPI00388C3A5A